MSWRNNNYFAFWSLRVSFILAVICLLLSHRQSGCVNNSSSYLLDTNSNDVFNDLFFCFNETAKYVPGFPVRMYKNIQGPRKQKQSQFISRLFWIPFSFFCFPLNVSDWVPFLCFILPFSNENDSFQTRSKRHYYTEKRSLASFEIIKQQGCLSTRNFIESSKVVNLSYTFFSQSDTLFTHGFVAHN